MKRCVCNIVMTLGVVLSVCLAVSAKEAPAKPFVHSLFTDNAILQRDIEAPIWGWTVPGSTVEVTLAPEEGKALRRTAVAADDGRWMVKTASFPAGGPYTLTVTGAETFTAKDILFGDVWICSGQSNMEMGISKCKNAAAEIEAANFPKIRLFTVPKKIKLAPMDTTKSAWLVCSPKTLVGYGWGGFSGAGYFFGRGLHKELGVPVGLIQTAWGGTIAEAWTSGEALASSAAFKARSEFFSKTVKKIQAGDYDYNQVVEAWWKEHDRGVSSNPQWSAADLNDTEWKTMDLPQAWERGELPGFDGVVWFRKTVELPVEWADKSVVLELGPVDDIDTTFVNGTKVGSMKKWNARRTYTVPAGVFHAGKNSIAVRVLDTGGGGGIYGTPEQMRLSLAGETGVAPLSLAGEWKYSISAGAEVKNLFPKQIGGSPNTVSVLYNGMIAPLLPCAIKGAIWYQGESNAGRAQEYQTLLSLMIRDWRARFTSAGDAQFPFGVVMLAGFMSVADTPVQEGWASLREAQLLTAQNVSNVGIASAVDIGNAKDIHPKNKQEVGRRLALWALGTTYGKDVVYSGPLYDSMKVEGNAIRLQFKHIGGGLVSNDGKPLAWFAVCGADKKFVRADAVIDGETVLVSAKDVTEPIAVRYGWANNPEGANLYNKEGLPAIPFRTDVQ